MSDEFDAVLAAVGPRLRELRRRRGATLTALSDLPHWFGNADSGPAEFLSILGPQGERFHIRARYRPA